MKTNHATIEPAPGNTSGPSTASRWALAGLSLSMLLASLGTSIANVALPALVEAFGATFQEVQWIVIAYLLAVTSLIVSVGRLGDILGRRRLLLFGIVAFTLASALGGAATTLGWLIAARAVQGIGAAAMMALATVFVGETVPKDRTGRAMGLLGTTSAIGTALGPSLGGLLLSGFGWRAIFLLQVPLGLGSFLLVRRFLPEDRGGSRQPWKRFDRLGTLLLALSLAAYSLGMTIGRGHFGPLNVVLWGAAAGLAGIFVFVEATTETPLLRLGLLRNRTVSVGLLTSALVATVIMTTLVVGPYYLSLVLGLSAASVGIVLSIGPLMAALTGVPAGRAVDQWGTERVMRFGLLGVGGGSVVFAALPAPTGVAGYLAPLVMITVGYALFQTANTTAVLRDLPSDQRGVMSGMLNLSRNLGLITGASVMGAVFASASRVTVLAEASPEALGSGLRTTFAVAAGLMAGAWILVTRHRGTESLTSLQTEPAR